MDEELADLIVQDLVRHRSRNEIIRSVCERSGLNWTEAERLVKQVEQQRGGLIARRQGPLLVFLSIGTLLIGILLVFYSIQFFIVFFQEGTLEQVLSLRAGYYQIAGALSGLGMIVGGLIGTWRALSPLFKE